MYASTVPPLTRSSTRIAPCVSQWSSTLVGALHWTGVGGPLNETMRGPVGLGTVFAGVDELGGTVVGFEVVLAGDVVELPRDGPGAELREVTVDVVVDVGDRRLEEWLLPHAAGSTTAVTIASEARRGRRTRMIVGRTKGADRTRSVSCLGCPASSMWRNAT